MFWSQLQAPRPGNKPTGEIKTLIESKHKTFDAFKKELIRSAMTPVQGSGICCQKTVIPKQHPIKHTEQTF